MYSVQGTARTGNSFYVLGNLKGYAIRIGKRPAAAASDDGWAMEAALLFELVHYVKPRLCVRVVAICETRVIFPTGTA